MPKRRHVKIRPDRTGLNFLTGGPAGVGDFDDEKIRRKELAREDLLIEAQTLTDYKKANDGSVIIPLVNKWPNTVDVKAMIAGIGIVGSIITGSLVSSLAGILVLLGTGLSMAGVQYVQQRMQNDKRQSLTKNASEQHAVTPQKTQEHHATVAVRPDKTPDVAAFKPSLSR